MRHLLNSLAVVLLLLGLGAAPFWFDDETKEDSPAQSAETDEMAAKVDNSPKLVVPPQQIEQTVEAEPPAIPEAVFARLPMSLRGAPAPLPLSVDEQGRVVVDDKVKKLFDYYLTAIGEESLALIVARIKHQLNAQLNPAQSAQVELLLENYLKYRNALGAILNDEKSGDTVRSWSEISRLREQIAAARRELFDPQTIEAFFAEQDQYDDYMAARAKLNADDSLDVAQKREALSRLDSAAPDWLKAQQRKSNQLNDYHRQAASLGANEDTEALRAMAEQQFGPEAADRLMALKQKQAQWKQTLERYHSQLKLLLSDVDRNSDDFKAQLNRLRARFFEKKQLKRVAALDSVQFGI